MSGNKLYEYLSFDNAHMVVESRQANGEIGMKGIFIQGDKQNHNQRVYPVNEISNAVESVNRRIAQGQTVLGEMDHPEELSINLDRVSHIITEMWMSGNDGYGKLKIVPTPMGNIVKTLIESGAKLGVSSRGSGNVNDNGYVSDFDIVTVDVVAQPSAPEAFPKTIYESLYNMKGGAAMFETARAATYDTRAQVCLEKDIIKFINDLKI